MTTVAKLEKLDGWDAQLSQKLLNPYICRWRLLNCSLQEKWLNI